MKIAIIIRRLNVRGGAQRQALSLAQELKRRGHSVRLYAVFGDGGESYPELYDGISVTVYKSSISFSKKSSGKFFGLLRQIVEEQKIAEDFARQIDPDTDILNPHDQLAYKVASLFKCRVKNIPSVWMMNDLPTRWFSLWRDGECGRKKPGIIKLFLARIFDKFSIIPFARAQDAITVLDEQNAERVRRFFKREATVVRSGVDTSRILYKKKMPPKEKTLSILLIGILFPHRRFEDGIDAAALLKKNGYSVRVDIVGDESQSRAYSEYLHARVASLNLSDTVHFLGKVSEEELATQYASHDVFIFPNHLQSWGLAVFEAMAAGLPVIVSKTAGASEVLTDGLNALFIEPKLPSSIAEALRRLAESPELFEKLSKNSRAFVEKNISWEKYADQMMEIFQTVLKK